MGDRRFAWVVCGFVLAGLLPALVGPVRAQQTWGGRNAVASGEADLPGVLQPAPIGGRPQGGDDDNAAGGASQDDSGREPEDPDLLDPAAKSGQNGAGPDADSNSSNETSIEKDGVVDGAEPKPVLDAGEESSGDTNNSADDYALFENPPSPPDPLLYQIEDLDPIQDSRTPRRLFRQAPYDPVGIKMGSFVLFPELVIGGSWYSNVFHAPHAQSDAVLDVLPAARLVSNWSRHALEFRGTGGLSWYDQYHTEDDRDYLLEGRGRLDITRRANVQALISSQRSLEDRSALDASSVGTRATLLSERAEAAYNQRFNRLAMQIRGSVQDYSYGNTEDAGVVTNNQDRDYTAYEQAGRVSWELKPTLSPFVEVAVNQRDYAEAAQSDGINRTSTGERYRLGVSFGNTGDILRGEMSLGYGIQTPDSHQLHPVDGLIVDANATWRVSELTSVLFTASSDVSETTTADVGGAFYRSAGVEVRHQFRNYLVGSAGFSYSNQNSQDGIINDNDFRETLGVEYYADRETVLFARYAHVNFDGVGVPNDYTGDEVHFGVRLRR